MFSAQRGTMKRATSLQNHWNSLRKACFRRRGEPWKYLLPFKIIGIPCEKCVFGAAGNHKKGYFPSNHWESLRKACFAAAGNHTNSYFPSNSLDFLTKSMFVAPRGTIKIAIPLQNHWVSLRKACFWRRGEPWKELFPFKIIENPCEKHVFPFLSQLFRHFGGIAEAGNHGKALENKAFRAIRVPNSVPKVHFSKFF